MSKTSPIASAYAALEATGKISPDAAQQEAILLLEKLKTDLEAYHAAKIRPWVRLFGNGPAAPNGLYIYGEVGRGKSFLMDLFFANVGVKNKKRIHFHQFMLEVHDKLHKYRTSPKLAEENDGIIPRLAHALAKESSLLCFDEFHVSNIADAMILGRLFQELFACGVTVVATSNSAPEDLYKGGLQRERFLPFIAILKKHMVTHYLRSKTDYRYAHLNGLPHYLHPLSPETTAQLRAAFATATNGAPPESLDLPVQGRMLHVPLSAQGCAYFSFAELCGRPLAAADYLALANCFSAIFLEGVPRLTPERRNEALRFVYLIDALYESHTQIYLSADELPENLCATGDSAFAFQRAASRLIEMQTEPYRRSSHLSS